MNTNAADSSHPTLVVFCRRPLPGHGKQRMSASLAPDQICKLAGLLLDTALEDASAWPGPVVIAPSRAADRSWAAQLLGNRAGVCAQPEGNLGDRLNAVDRDLRARGHQRLIYIGSDAPLLDQDYYTGACLALDRHDVVLGPADDGGVVLMGSRRPWPELHGLPWSGDNLGAALELACTGGGLTVQYLPNRYDIDLAQDLPRLCADLATDPRPARRTLRDWLERHAGTAATLNRSDGTRP